MHDPQITTSRTQLQQERTHGYYQEHGLSWQNNTNVAMDSMKICVLYLDACHHEGHAQDLHTIFGQPGLALPFWRQKEDNSKYRQ